MSKRNGRSGNGGDGGKPDRRTGVDRRISDTHPYDGPERRQGPRRKPDRQPDKPAKRQR